MRRRDFLAHATSVAVAAGWSTTVRGMAPPLSSAPRHLPYGDVRLTDGLALAQANQTLDALLAIDDALLLRPFRERAGLPIGEARLGGWYDFDPAFVPGTNMSGFIPGHSFGQYLSALSRGYAALGRAEAKKKADRLVAGLAPAITSEFYRDYPLPAYTFEKTLAGLVDAYRLTGNQQALALYGPATDAVLPWMPDRAQDRRVSELRRTPNSAFGWDETYTLAEVLYLAASHGGGERFARMAPRYLLDDVLFLPLAHGENPLPGRHAYSHLNALCSAMQAYVSVGSQMHLEAARHGMDFVLAQSWITGGWGPREAFITPGSGELGKSLATTHNSFEAPCGTYAHFKLVRYLLEATGDLRYADSMERLFFNSALGVLPLKSDGTAFYYADYSDSGTKVYYKDKCPCCSGTIGQLTADYGISSYMTDDTGIYVNLYHPSQAIWRRHGEPAVTVAQSGTYPFGNTIRLEIQAARPTSMALRLRIPGWAGNGTSVTVNGRNAGLPRPGTYLNLARKWKSGDVVELRMDMPLRLSAVDAEHPDKAAVTVGPLALFATGAFERGYTSGELMRLSQLSAELPAWSLPGASDKVRFMPWTALHEESYRLYQQV